MNGREKSRTFLWGGGLQRDMSPQCPDPHVPQKTTLQKLIKIIEASSGSDSLMSYRSRMFENPDSIERHRSAAKRRKELAEAGTTQIH